MHSENNIRPNGYYMRIMLNEQRFSPKFKINTTAIWQMTF